MIANDMNALVVLQESDIKTCTDPFSGKGRLYKVKHNSEICYIIHFHSNNRYFVVDAGKLPLESSISDVPEVLLAEDLHFYIFRGRTTFKNPSSGSEIKFTRAQIRGMCSRFSNSL